MNDKIWRITVKANLKTVHTAFAMTEEERHAEVEKASHMKWENLMGYSVEGEVFVEESDVSWRLYAPSTLHE